MVVMLGEFGPGMIPATHTFPTRFRSAGGRFRQLYARNPIIVRLPAFLFPRGLNQLIKSETTRLRDSGERELKSSIGVFSGGQVRHSHAADC